MEFLVLKVLAGNFVDSGPLYEDAGSCYAEAQNTGMAMREIGMSSPNFVCIPATPRSSFPFN